ncbi:hypothetical protein DXO170_10805 [Xanthomonas oryzae pv. oryzae]|uniref:Uncharacterized protein n=2 Tax=Xanthomonas oryzae pv. oryzae TaxID=64187 RepID=A0A854CGZ0_XANOO|nr:hypothetical protein PXO_05474 [Xanthomonas oryzae pv. oryzae PXO99A]ALZ70713.1 hypothetical protein APZ20_03475 [Xanthomonas oryzae pv. oryzae]AOS03927.1 hypothetical protein ATY42_19585 [Xanthomonas oryzae pv. oryzae]AOS07285.1 hypothetical protein ATY43_15950 [Xanthomonas oryzae pv. oryzae]AOS09537.1 hypothetical protein ATY44_03500 [Xanthomonas oryzae pv. oryzae]
MLGHFVQLHHRGADLFDAGALFGAGSGDLGMMAVTRFTELSTSVMVVPACCTNSEPCARAETLRFG